MASDREPNKPSEQGRRSTMSVQQMEFKGVTVVAKANVFFDGKVVSHTILLADGTRKSVGVVFPGKFHFGTDKAERMEITGGDCEVTVDGKAGAQRYAAGHKFEVPAKSGFDIEVKSGLCEYVCTFLG
jgi:purine/pyrimidine-nucleoside phosphorylase